MLGAVVDALQRLAQGGRHGIETLAHAPDLIDRPDLHGGGKVTLGQREGEWIGLVDLLGQAFAEEMNDENKNGETCDADRQQFEKERAQRRRTIHPPA